MIRKQYFITLLAGVLAMGFLFTALPETSNAQIPEGCCQYINTQTNQFSCSDIIGNFGCPLPIGENNPIQFINFFADSSCDDESGTCSGFQGLSNVPTLSEWGLIAMAGVIGIVGFIVIRRRTASAGI